MSRANASNGARIEIDPKRGTILRPEHAAAGDERACNRRLHSLLK